jgi:hypothetical protein
MLYFDLDGVLREFGTYILGYEPTHWDATKDGKTVIEIVNEHPEICLYCPETKYLKIVNEYMDKITVISNQLPSWMPFTNKWLNNHIKIPYEVIYTSGPKEKLAMLKPGDYIVEDYPCFDNYSQVALINYAYNRHLDVPIRISNTEDLERFLLSFDDIYERVI